MNTSLIIIESEKSQAEKRIFTEEFMRLGIVKQLFENSWLLKSECGGPEIINHIKSSLNQFDNIIVSTNAQTINCFGTDPVCEEILKTI